MNSLESIKELDAWQLQKYCDSHRDQCGEVRLWHTLLKENYPDIFNIAAYLAFPDIEKGKRREERDFLPLRELYFQLLVLSENAEELALVDAILNEENLDNFDLQTKDNLRFYYQTLSYLLSHKSWEWKKYLVKKEDPLLRYLGYTIEDLTRLLCKDHFDSAYIASWYLKHTRASPAFDCGGMIISVAEHGQREVVRVMLKHPQINPAIKDNSAIIRAAANGHPDVVRLLLEDGRVDPTARNNEAIRLALQGGHTEVVELLLSDERLAGNAEEQQMV